MKGDGITLKVVIFAGGYGTRLSEETENKPKPLVEIGGRPILWHIMKLYSYYGYNEFIICLGYKGNMISDYFVNYFIRESNLQVDLNCNEVTILSQPEEKWKVKLIHTGQDTLTGGRLKRIQPYINEETFMLTYGDGLSNVNINELVDFHKKHKKIGTLTAVQPEGRFGTLLLDSTSSIKSFIEKPKGATGWINGGYFVFSSKIFNYLKDDNTVLEKEPLEQLTKEAELMAFKHAGFWHPMDTLKDKKTLNKMWDTGKADWKLW